MADNLKQRLDELAWAVLDEIPNCPTPVARQQAILAALTEAVRAALGEPSEGMKRAAKGSTTMFATWNRMAAARLKEIE